MPTTLRVIARLHSARESFRRELRITVIHSVKARVVGTAFIRATAAMIASVNLRRRHGLLWSAIEFCLGKAAVPEILDGHGIVSWVMPVVDVLLRAEFHARRA